MSRLLVVAGPAGSGKTTLADAFAAKYSVPHIDFDAATAELVAEQRARDIDADEAALLLRIKAERYLAFAQAVGTELQLHEAVVASAPFTSYVRSDDDWTSWTSLLPDSTDVTVAWLVIDPELRLLRMRGRGSSRDSGLIDVGSLPVADLPGIDYLAIPADAPLEESIQRISSQLW